MEGAKGVRDRTIVPVGESAGGANLLSRTVSGGNPGAGADGDSTASGCHIVMVR